MGWKQLEGAWGWRCPIRQPSDPATGSLPSLLPCYCYWLTSYLATLLLLLLTSYCYYHLVRKKEKEGKCGNFPHLANPLPPHLENVGLILAFIPWIGPYIRNKVFFNTCLAILLPCYLDVYLLLVPSYLTTWLLQLLSCYFAICYICSNWPMSFTSKAIELGTIGFGIRPWTRNHFLRYRFHTIKWGWGQSWKIRCMQFKC